MSCRAQQLSLAHYADKENLPLSGNKASSGGGGGSFFRKKNALRSKSLGKDHWDTAIFGMYFWLFFVLTDVWLFNKLCMAVYLHACYVIFMFGI